MPLLGSRKIKVSKRRGIEMSIISIIVVLVVVGLVLYLINTYIPMARPVKTVLNVFVVLMLCLWILNAFGIVNEHIPIRLN